MGFIPKTLTSVNQLKPTCVIIDNLYSAVKIILSIVLPDFQEMIETQLLTGLTHYQTTKF